jgi:hypothetical protein
MAWKPEITLIASMRLAVAWIRPAERSRYTQTAYRYATWYRPSFTTCMACSRVLAIRGADRQDCTDAPWWNHTDLKLPASRPQHLQHSLQHLGVHWCCW